MRHLRLAATELAKDLADTHGLEATAGLLATSSLCCREDYALTRREWYQAVCFLSRSSGRVFAAGRVHVQSGSRLLLAVLVVSEVQSCKVRSIYLALGDGIFDLVHLDLTETLDLQQIATSRRVHRSNRVIAVGLELGNVDRTDTVGLNRIDVDNEAILSQKISHNRQQ
jgi:hypothetical protein